MRFAHRRYDPHDARDAVGEYDATKDHTERGIQPLIDGDGLYVTVSDGSETETTNK